MLIVANHYKKIPKRSYLTVDFQKHCRQIRHSLFTFHFIFSSYFPLAIRYITLYLLRPFFLFYISIPFLLFLLSFFLFYSLVSFMMIFSFRFVFYYILCQWLFTDMDKHTCTLLLFILYINPPQRCNSYGNNMHSSLIIIDVTRHSKFLNTKTCLLTALQCLVN